MYLCVLTRQTQEENNFVVNPAYFIYIHNTHIYIYVVDTEKKSQHMVLLYNKWNVNYMHMHECKFKAHAVFFL